MSPEMQGRKAIQYAPLLEAQGDKEEAHEDVERNDNAGCGPSNRKWTMTFSIPGLVLLLLVQILITVCINVAVAIWMRPSTSSPGIDLRVGEFAPTTEALKSEQVLFVASTTFNKSLTPPRRFRDDVPLYIGEPSPAIDEAWNKLLDDQYFYISDEEAERAWGPEYQQYYRDEERGYRAGLDVFHTLHCLNMLRKEIHRSYYRPNDFAGYLEDVQAYHIDHCVDVVRQSLQCSSDLTPIPVVWYDEKTGNSAIDSERMHTCRNNHDIREWVTARLAATDFSNAQA